MKFLVISDIHDNLVNLEKCAAWGRRKGINKAVCCGDVVNGETLKYMAEIFELIYLVRGNLELYEESEVKRYSGINYLGRFGIFEADGKTAGSCHEPWYITNALKIKNCRV